MYLTYIVYKDSVLSADLSLPTGFQWDFCFNLMTYYPFFRHNHNKSGKKFASFVDNS